MFDVDVAIVGAGAAGLGAAHALRRSGLAVLILEARDRIGGRALTKHLDHGIVFDVGCEWLHSADTNALVALAGSLGFDIITAQTQWAHQSENINFPLTEKMQFRAASESFVERLQSAAELDEDTAAADWLEPGNKWNPLLNAVSSFVNGVELPEVSVHDSDSYADTNVNWRVRRGLGSLISAYGSDCPVVLSTAVSCIDHSGTMIKLVTTGGNIRARCVVYTLPTAMTANETVRFHPSLPAKADAAAALPMGNAEKVMLKVEDARMLPVDGHVFGRIDQTRTGSYELCPSGLPCIEAFFGGTLARELEAKGQLAQFAIDELAALFGSDFRRRITPLSSSAWSRDRFAGGAYSYARVGRSPERSILARPIDDRLFFAGEATSISLYSTAHGAYETGLRAAAEVAATLGVLESNLNY
jgi:monoamine oxidase